MSGGSYLAFQVRPLLLETRCSAVWRVDAILVIGSFSHLCTTVMVRTSPSRFAIGFLTFRASCLLKTEEVLYSEVVYDV